MKVKVLKDFKDKYTGKRHTAGETITVSKDRFEEILTVDTLVEAVAEDIAETTEEAVEQPKKTTRKATKKPAK